MLAVWFFGLDQAKLVSAHFVSQSKSQRPDQIQVGEVDCISSWEKLQKVVGTGRNELWHFAIYPTTLYK